MRYVNLPILTILIGIIGGIAITNIAMLPFVFILAICGGLLLSLALHQWMFHNRYSFRYGLLLHSFLASVAIGMLLVAVHTPANAPQHYTHQLTTKQSYVLQGRVLKQVSKTSFGDTFRVQLLAADNKKVSGDILCFFPRSKDSVKVNSLHYKDEIFFLGEVKPIAPPQPYQFDYKQYMERQGVYGRTVAKGFIIRKKGEGKGYVQQIRGYFSKLIEANFEKETSQLLQTLLLSKRTDLSNELLQSYIDAGAVHILAISGLHVGIITMILLFLIQRLPNSSKGYQWLRYIILLVGLWSFTLIAGSTPSVLRATVMFSFIGLYFLSRNPQGRFDALIVSMLVLLLINPFYLYEVGFQLSYAAVFSILTFYPAIMKWWYPENKFLRWVWQLLVVGFTAQIAIVPISLYYFHQFSGLFFVSNLLVVPLLQPVLILSIIALLLGALLGYVPSLLVMIIRDFVAIMNTLIRSIAGQEDFILRNIPFNTLLLLASLLLVAALVYWRHFRSYRSVVLILLSILLLQGVLFYNKYQLTTTDEMLIFTRFNEKTIVIRQGNRLDVFQSDTLELNSMVQNYIKKIGVNDIRIKKFPNVLCYNKKKYLLIDSLGIYPISKQVVIDSVIFLQQTPKINLDRMKQNLSLRY